ncbi:hypothetical protein D3C87_995580 [compost metagenome]
MSGIRRTTNHKVQPVSGEKPVFYGPRSQILRKKRVNSLEALTERLSKKQILVYMSR